MLGVIILAAGRGTRMKSSIPKVMHKIAGTPMIEHILNTVSKLSPVQTIIVANQFLKKHMNVSDVDFIIQEEQLGTGHAVQCALPHLSPLITKILILCGDTPLIKNETLQDLIAGDCGITIMAMMLNDEERDKPYGRLVIDDHHVHRIVEIKDANDHERKINIANTGVYFGKRDVIETAIKTLSNNNQAQEYYLTDIIENAHHQKYKVGYKIASAQEFIGVNTRVDLAHAENIFQNHLRQYHMENGVTLVDPGSVFFHDSTKIAQDVTIYPNVIFGKDVTADKGVVIYPNCYLEDCHLGVSSTVGPFAHLRGGSILMENAEIGNFVELKNTTLHKGAKAKHLSYLGDAVIGENANIGAGSITCNYNGFIKSKTVIGNNAFIGSNVSLIAPVTINDNAIVAAGSTITKDVPQNAIAIERTEQIIKKSGAVKFRARFEPIKT